MRTVPVTTDKQDKQPIKIQLTPEQGWVKLWGQEKAHFIRADRSLCREQTYKSLIFHTDTVKPKCMRCQRLKRKEK